MNKYYLYIEKERTRVFTDKSNGKPIEFNIDGVKTTELYNTVHYDLPTDSGGIFPLHRSYEQNYSNVYNLNEAIGGWKNDAYLSIKIYLHMKKIIDLLDVKEGELRILFSYSFLQNLIENDVKLNDKSFEEIIGVISEEQGYNFVFKGAYFVMPLVDSMFYFLAMCTKGNLLYIDEKIAKMDYRNRYANTCYWGIVDDELEAERDKYFLEYLKKEELYDNQTDYENIKDYVFHEAKKGNDIKTITINRRDERLVIDCTVLRDFLKKAEKEKYKHLEEFIEEYIKDINICLLNINNQSIKKKVEKILKKYNVKIFEKDNYFSILLKYCEMVDKYNSARYKTRLFKLGKDKHISPDKFMFGGKLYNIYNILMSNNEEKEVLKYLGLIK